MKECCRLFLFVDSLCVVFNLCGRRRIQDEEGSLSPFEERDRTSRKRGGSTGVYEKYPAGLASSATGRSLLLKDDYLR